MIAKDLKFEEINIGDTATFDKTFTNKDVEDFARLSGDFNPLHTDESYAKTTQFKKPIIHGMLVGSLCSTLLGMYLPGKKCLYISQTLSFKNPVFVGDKLTVTGNVKTKSVGTRLLEISISITKGAIDVVKGEAIVKVL